jgi:maltose/moltooligosaccharide transporter
MLEATLSSDGKVFHAGSLTYTKAALFSLFAWLLWSGFCLLLVQTAVPAVLQINVNEMGAPNWALGLILSTIPAFLSMAVGPGTGFWSDRLRSRWGRRIPFLFLGSLPLALSLVLLGCSREIGGWLHTTIHGDFSQTALIVGVVCVLTFLFQIFNIVVFSVFLYLFNDVVPAGVISRFMAIFRVLGVLASAAFNWFFLKYAAEHMMEIFMVAAALYATAFFALCWKVREGEYPPPPIHPDGGSGLISSIKTFFVESYSLRFYWLFFLANACFALTGVAGGFEILYARSIGVDLDFYGKTVAVAGVAGAALIYPAGILSDRLHPLRIMLWSTIALLVIEPLWLIFLFYDFSPAAAHGIFVGIMVVYTPAMAFYIAAELPMFMRILPLSRYGQFCSANAVVRSLAIIAGGLLTGLLLDRLAIAFPRKDFCYRMIPLLSLVSIGASLFFLRKLFAEWLKLGGEVSYRPPGFEGTDGTDIFSTNATSS